MPVNHSASLGIDATFGLGVELTAHAEQRLALRRHSGPLTRLTSAVASGWHADEQQSAAAALLQALYEERLRHLLSDKAQLEATMEDFA